MKTDFTSSNAVQVALCRSVMINGSEVRPRGLLTRELLGVSFVITDPRNRLTQIPGRRWNPSLAVAELAWNLRAEQSVEPLAFYVPRWREFADDDGALRGSCYGASIFGATGGVPSQWEQVRSLLRSDPETRRAVLSLRRELDVSAPTNDLSCTNTIQFIVREGRVHAFVNMRSNDVIWGVPYDVFLFSTLQELMALELGFQLGRYHHYAASMHIYERHFSLAEKLAKLDPSMLRDGRMPSIETKESLYRLAEAEVSLRTGRGLQIAVPTQYEGLCLTLLKDNPALAA